MTQTKDLMKKSADLTDYQPPGGVSARLTTWRERKMSRSLSLSDSKHHLMLP